MNYDNQTEIWLNTYEVADLLNTSERTIQRKCNNNNYITKFIDDTRKKEYKILLTSLPTYAQNLYHEKINSTKKHTLNNKNILATMSPDLTTKNQINLILQICRNIPIGKNIVK